MSYILEALRKSEQQRQLTEVPSLYTAQLAAGQESQPAFILYALTAAILIGAGILIGWWRPWQATEVANATSVTARPANDPPPSQNQLVPESPRKFEPLPQVKEATSVTPPPPKQDERRPHRQHATALPRSRIGAPVSPAAMETPAPTASSAANQAVTPRISDSAPSGTKGPTGNGSAELPETPKVIALEDLPPAVRQDLPPMAISGFTYSEEPRQRIVGINDRLLQEGQYLAPGLRLEQIGPDGLVFSYREYRFRKSLP